MSDSPPAAYINSYFDTKLSEYELMNDMSKQYIIEERWCRGLIGKTRSRNHRPWFRFPPQSRPQPSHFRFQILFNPDLSVGRLPLSVSFYDPPFTIYDPKYSWSIICTELWWKDIVNVLIWYQDMNLYGAVSEHRTCMLDVQVRSLLWAIGLIWFFACLLLEYDVEMCLTAPGHL